MHGFKRFVNCRKLPDRGTGVSVISRDRPSVSAAVASAVRGAIRLRAVRTAMAATTNVPANMKARDRISHLRPTELLGRIVSQRWLWRSTTTRKFGGIKGPLQRAEGRSGESRRRLPARPVETCPMVPFRQAGWRRYPRRQVRSGRWLALCLAARAGPLDRDGAAHGRCERRGLQHSGDFPDRSSAPFRPTSSFVTISATAPLSQRAL